VAGLLTSVSLCYMLVRLRFPGSRWFRAGLQHPRTRVSRYCAASGEREEMIRRTQVKRVLCVAEKNDAAKCISEIMSGGRARRVRASHVYYSPISEDIHVYVSF